MDTNKACVFLRGAPRTWNYVKQDFFAAIESVYEDIDWFVCFPESSTVSEQSLKKDFYGKNLISLLTVKNYAAPKKIHDPQRWSGFGQNYFKVAWYDYLLGIEKRRHQLTQKINYSLVMYTRPDLYITSENVAYKSLRINDSVGITSKNLQTHINGELMSNDIQFFMGSRAADILNSRFYDTDFTDGLPNQAVHGDHQNIVYYLFKNFISLSDATGFLGASMVRPNAIEYFLSENKDNQNTKVRKLEEFNSQWQSLSIDQKRHWCQKYNISTLDFK